MERQPSQFLIPTENDSALFDVSGAFVLQPRMGFGIGEHELGSFRKQGVDRFVVSRTGHAMNADVQGVFLRTGLDVGGGDTEFGTPDLACESK